MRFTENRLKWLSQVIMPHIKVLVLGNPLRVKNGLLLWEQTCSLPIAVSPGHSVMSENSRDSKQAKLATHCHWVWWCCTSHSFLGHIQVKLSAPMTSIAFCQYSNFTSFSPTTYSVIALCFGSKWQIKNSKGVVILTLTLPNSLTNYDCKMVTTPCKCKGKEGEMCYRFLPSLAKDTHELCVTCRSQNCSLDLRCNHWASWSFDK